MRLGRKTLGATAGLVLVAGLALLVVVRSHAGSVTRSVASGPSRSMTHAGCVARALPSGTNPHNAALVINSLNGSVTDAEVTTFRGFVARRALPTTSLDDALVYGSAGTDTEAMGAMYQVSARRRNRPTA